MSPPRTDPLAAYTFHVWLGEQEFGFSQVSGLSREAEPVIYQEGGVNDRVHVLCGPVKSPGALSLRRGAYAGESFPFYLAGERLTEPLLIAVRAPAPQQTQGKFYMATGLLVKKWEVGELDALQNTLLIDSFTLSYEHLDVTVR